MSFVVKQQDQSEKVIDLVDLTLHHIVPYFRAADDDVIKLEISTANDIRGEVPISNIVSSGKDDQPAFLEIPVQDSGLGKAGVSAAIDKLLQNSVNASSPRLLDKLWSSPSPPGIAADLLQSCMNGYAHVLHDSPGLTSIEKRVGIELARLFELDGSSAGGITVPGGAAANQLAFLTARNVRFPKAKRNGLRSLPRLAIFVSEDAHSSVIAAAEILGLGSESVWQITTTTRGSMDAEALRAAMKTAVSAGFTPLLVLGTAGTIVRGAYDPLYEIGCLARAYNAWYHIDACWGGAAVFSDKLRYKLRGCEFADSISFSPQHLLEVPQQCSFLIGRDMRLFSNANKQSTAYLFQQDVSFDCAISGGTNTNFHDVSSDDIDLGVANWPESPIIEDIADLGNATGLASLTTQLGRRSDALKMYLHWIYYGTEGMGKHVEAAFDAASYFSQLVLGSPLLDLVGGAETPNAQVCFYYIGSDRRLYHDLLSEEKHKSQITVCIVERLTAKGWMVDYASGSGQKGQRGYFLRMLCNRRTTREIAKRFLEAVIEAGASLSML